MRAVYVVVEESQSEVDVSPTVEKYVFRWWIF